MALENSVSQLRAVPRPDTGASTASAEAKVSLEGAARADAAAPVVAPMDERQLAQWELMTDQLLSANDSRSWHVRHARKLIGAGAVLAAAGVALFSYDAWRPYKEPPAAAAPVPAKALPGTPSAPIAVAPQGEAPAKPAAAAPSARASLPARPATPAVPTAALAVQPAEAAPRAATISRSIRPVAPIPAVAPAAPRSTGPRVPPVTHTLREEPAPDAAPAMAATPTAVATVPVATPPVAAPTDCPDAIAALGLCASHARKGIK